MTDKSAFVSEDTLLLLGVVVHVYNLSTWEVEEGAVGVQD